MEKEKSGRGARMTKLLSLVWYKVLPPRFGGQKGIAGFNQHLAAHFPVVCLCSSDNRPTGDEPYTVLAELPAGRIQVLNPLAWQKVKDTAAREHITHLILEHPYYGLPALWLKRRKGVRLISHAHNIEYQRFRELGRWWWPLLRSLERAVHRGADLNLYKTDLDLQHAVAAFGLDGSRCLVVPFGLERKGPPSERERREARSRIGEALGLSPEERILYFNGTLDYLPNADALRALVMEILPALAEMAGQPFRLIVTGRNLKPGFGDLHDLRHERYVYAGLADNVEDFFLAADCFVCPVRSGGGIKVKVMEALSWGLPVVCIDHAAEGIDPGLTGSLLRTMGSGDTEGFCRAILEAWEDRSVLPGTFFETYHWDRVILPVEIGRAHV
jgi:glycosyltransferase involved in cell wall biosynthesis